jgi:hypothetical protein|tara:strand:- start:732 stop:1436 length:705 start_codon:yes stop_codon:yes gene_type:complete
MKHIQLFEKFINEGRSKYDGLASKLVTNVFKHWVNIHKGGGKDLKYFDSIEDSRVKLEFDLYATLHVTKEVKGFTVLNSTGADGRDEDDEGEWNTPHINIDFAINPDWLPGEWSMVYFHLVDVMRHEMEHLTQDGKDIGNYRQGKPDEDDSRMRQLIEIGFLDKYHYLILPKEVDANLQGLRFESKKRKESMSDSVDRYLDLKQEMGEVDNKTREIVLSTWRRRAKEIGGIPKF